MKKLRLILLTLFAIGLSNCEISVRESNASTSTVAKPSIYTDKLGCTWFIVTTRRYDGGVSAEHHPTCKNPNHR